MVLQKPNTFPTMSIFDNVAAGLRLTGRRGDVRERVEQSLRGAGLWDEVKDRVTIAIVTHNMQQAARVADTTAFMLSGELVEVASTEKMFTNPDDERTEQYVSGKFG